METLSEIKCLSCNNSCSLLPPDLQDKSLLYQKFSCNECKVENYAIKCKYCSSVVQSLLKKDFAPGATIKCRIQACSKEFQYLKCPNYDCNKFNYRVAGLEYGVLEKCDCGTAYKSYLCDNCQHVQPQKMSVGFFGSIVCNNCSKSLKQLTCTSCERTFYSAKHGLTSMYWIDPFVKCSFCIEKGPTANHSNSVSGKFSNFETLSSNKSISLFNNSTGPSSTSSDLFTNAKAPTPSLFNNSQILNSNVSSSLFNNSQAPSSNTDNIKPSADDLTQRINDIKETDDTPTQDEEKQCLICFENQKKVVFIPCNHLSCCLACTKAIMKKQRECPVCKQHIADFQIVFSP